MTDQAVYVYAVVRSMDPDVLQGVSGVRGRSIRLVSEADLTALVSDVGLDEFGEEGLRRHLEDLIWLESVARAHNAVVELAFRHGPVAPLSLATVCFDDSGVRDRLSAMHGRVEEVLTRITGRAELGVKVYAQPSLAPEDTAVATQSATEGSSPGKAYLQRRRSEAARRDEASRSVTMTAEQVHSALAGGAVASRRHPPQDRRLTGHEGDMILNGSYLVSVPGLGAFEELARTVRRGHPDLRVEVTGPWAPYSFAGLEEA